MAFAAGTEVSIQKTRMEIELLITKAGATSFVAGTSSTQRLAQIMFEMHGRRLIFRVTTADPAAFRFKGNHQRRNDSQCREAAEQEDRRLWRCLLLSIKAKLEGVSSGIESFDEAFLAHIVMPDGSTVGENTLPRIAEVYKTGTMLPLLPQRTGS